MTREQLHDNPILCQYDGYSGMISWDKSDPAYLFFLSNDKEGSTNRSLLTLHPEYRYSYALCFKLKDNEVNLEYIGITDFTYANGKSDDLVFKKIKKLQL